MGRPYTNNVEAWQKFKQGADFYRRFKKEDNAQARVLFEEAIRLDPEFARAYALLAATHRQDWTLAWTEDRETSNALAYRLAQHAVDLARLEPEPKPSLPYTLLQWAYVLLYNKRHYEASVVAEEAVQRNPNYTDGYAVWAQVLIYRGQPLYAIDRMEIAKRLDPKYPAYYDYHVGQAYYVEGFLTAERDVNASRQSYEQAETHLREALRKNQYFRSARMYLVAVLWEDLERQEEARAEMTILIQNLGRPRASENLVWFQEYIQQTHPYENGRIITHLIDVWQRAESQP